MKFRKYWVVLIAVILVSSLFISLSGCQSSPPAPAAPTAAPKPAASTQPIKIGEIEDLTSFVASVSAYAHKGVQLALEETPSIDGRPIQLILEDDASNPDQGLDKARKLVEQDKVTLIIGPLNGGVVVAVAPYLDKMKTPSIQYINQPNEIAAMTKSMFLSAGTHSEHTYAAGLYASQKLGYKTATTFALDFAGAYGFVDGFIEGFQKGGGQVVEKRWIPPTATDFSAYILGMKKADVAAVWMVGNTTVPFYKQYAELGKMPVVDIYTELDFPENRAGLGDIPAKLGVVSAIAWSYDETDKGSQDFTARYEKKFGAKPGHMAIMGYDATKIAIHALQRAKGDYSGENVIKAIAQTDEDTIYGKRFFGTGTLGIANPRIVVAKADGKGGYRFEIVERYKVKGTLEGKNVALSLVQ